jgi:energy-coupling factor transporter ATP-binding protein EcfA2
MAADFFDAYLAYTAGGEVPICYHRWSAIVGIGALLERDAYLTFGHSKIHPNQYVMLIGEAGTKKSTAIKLMKKLLIKSGFNHIAAEKTSGEAYLRDLADSHSESGTNEDVLERNIFGTAVNDALITPSLVAADEANTFFRINNVDFLTILGDLWDYEGKFENRIKTGKSDFIPNPTISILSGNTATNFSIAFPPAIFGNGFFSRLLLVYSEPTGIKITKPRTPTDAETEAMIRMIHQVKQVASIGEYHFRGKAFELIDAIYQNDTALIDDVRFASYHNRRLTHLYKLCLIVAAARLEPFISEETVIQANSYLRYIERLMPKALGEFGKAKNADVSHKVLSLIENKFPISLKDIFREISSELEKPADLGTIIQKLLMAEKIQSTTAGFLPKKKVESVEEETKLGFVDFERFLTPQELSVKR